MKSTIPLVSSLLLITLLTGARAQDIRPAKPGSLVDTYCTPPLKKLTVPIILMAGQEEGSKQGWFGVRLDLPGPALSMQLGLEDNGLVVINVSKESPADQSGLLQYDVIISFAGQEVGNFISALAGRILKLGDGAEVDYVVLRNAEELNLHASLGTRPKSKNWEWKYESFPDQLFKRNFVFSKKMIRRGPNGEIIIDDLGEEPTLPELFLKYIPEINEREIKLWNEDGLPRQKCVVHKGSTTIEIEGSGDGKIIIRRTKRKGNDQITTEDVYESEAALKKADPEAYDIYRDTRPWQPFCRIIPNPPDIDQPPPTLEYIEKVDEWRDAMSEALKKIKEQTKEKTQEQMERWEESVRPTIERLKESIEQYMSARGQARYRFQEEADGQISVTIRKGDSELIKVYENAETLREKNPSLFERYQNLQASE